eukprot:3719559-Pleurochrysis_carterae.AAC.1
MDPSCCASCKPADIRSTSCACSPRSLSTCCTLPPPLARVLPRSCPSAFARPSRCSVFVHPPSRSRDSSCIRSPVCGCVSDFYHST